MREDPFETVAIAYRQSEAAVIQSMFEFYGIPTLVRDAYTARVNAPWTLAIGGMRIQVLSEFAEEARELLTEVADRQTPPTRAGTQERTANFALGLLLLLFGAVPPPRIGAGIVSRR